MKRWLIDKGGAIALAVTAVYIALAPSWIVDGDNAEFATLSVTGGRAHPSGYPLYVLWLRMTSWLPGGTVAHTAAIATALLAGAQIAVLHAACRAWGARSVAATAAVGIYAVAPIALRMHTEAEVFALNGLVVATIAWLSATAGPLRGMARAVALGLIAGLGLANHMTCALVAPIGILGVVRGARESRRPVLAIVATIGAFAIGLAPYLYEVLAPDETSWGRIDSAGDLVALILRYDYGGPGSFATHSRGVDVAANLEAFAITVGRAWCWLFAIAGVITLGWRAVRTSTGETRVACILLAASWLAAGPLLAARFNIPPQGLGLYVVQRFHLLPITILAIPVAVAFDVVARRARVQVSAATSLTAIAAVIATVCAVSLPRLLGEHSRAMEAGVRNALEAFPERAIVLVGSEEQCLGMRYLQLAEHDRTDVDVVCWPLISRAWYVDPIVARGVPLGVQTGEPASPQDADRLLATGRPLFVDEAQSAIVTAFPNYPEGVFFRVLSRDRHAPPIHAVITENRAIYERFDLSSHPGVGDDYATIAFLRYRYIWRTLAAAADVAGNPDDAAFAHAMVDELTPR